LGKRFRQNHARNERIIGKMPSKHRIVTRELGFAFGRDSRVAGDQFPHKNEGRPVGQT